MQSLLHNAAILAESSAYNSIANKEMLTEKKNSVK